MPPLFRVLTALSGFLAVALGAIGAHWLAPTHRTLGTTEVWQTAAHYHLAHSVAAVAVLVWVETQSAKHKRFKWIASLWLVGSLLFSGSLYLLAVGGPRWLGPITPLGGLAYLIGWSLVALPDRKSTTAPVPK
jgi:uncharacterized membrane protein YgdD (TMEM256/DUF423 family)